MLKQRLGLFNQKYAEWQKFRKELNGYRSELQSEFSNRLAIAKSIQNTNDRNKPQNLYHSDEILKSN